MSKTASGHEPPSGGAHLYRIIWRWHFYAALFVMPLVAILATTGAAYLFKPQIERWEERAYIGLGIENSVSPNAQLDAALLAFPGAEFQSYRLPREPGDAAMIHIAMEDGIAMRDIFVSPQGKLLGSIDPDQRIAPILSKIHGSLFAGTIGDWIVELAACWAIVMILTGLYLWWPRGGGMAGVLWPRLTRGKRLFWRDLHAVTGFWISGLAIILLLTGLPWSNVWGNLFEKARAEMGWVAGARDWKIGSGHHTGHDHAAMLRQQAAGVPLVSLSDVVRRAEREHMAFPVLVVAPGADMAWTIRSETQNRPLRRSISIDMASGQEAGRSGFADKHAIDRAVGYGIAWHEGQLFGWVNQLIGVLTATGLLSLVVSGFVIWRRRKPQAGLGPPRMPATPARLKGAAFILLALAALLPLLALSLVALWLFDRFLLPLIPGLARWLGVAQTA